MLHGFLPLIQRGYETIAEENLFRDIVADEPPGEEETYDQRDRSIENRLHFESIELTDWAIIYVFELGNCF